MINAELVKGFENNKTLKSATITIEVEMTPSKLLSTLAVEVLKELHRIAPYAGFKDVDDLEEKDILAYLSTLVWMRVQKCSDFSPSFKTYRELSKRVAVPVMAYQLLIAIGVAVDKDYAIEFKPAYSITGDELLSPEEMRAISDVLSRLEPNGMKIVYGIPQSPEGELDFMALSHVGDVVLGYRQGHPVYGFLASFFAQKELNEVTGSMCRVIYGYESDYELYVREIFQKLNS